ncbi:MAG TPA: RNA methyltransferase [Burkholderiales bacterium]|nr:RNA methyltransferase [Burkholderiales bacterium]
MAADPLKNIRFVLCETAHPGNIGAAARALKTMGLGELHLVAPGRFPDPQAEWLASGATDVLRRARVHPTLDDALAGSALTVACTARPREIAVPMLGARDAAARVVDVARSQPAALVFGNETFGLTGLEVARCQLLATIPANPEYGSLNVAAAVQIFAYELRLAALGPVPQRGKAHIRATHEELERFFQHLERAMIEHGFLNPEHPKKLMPRLRRLFNRAELEREEVNILRGVIKALVHPKHGRTRRN